MLVLLAETEEDQIVVKEFFFQVSLLFFLFFSFIFIFKVCLFSAIFKACKIETFKT